MIRMEHGEATACFGGPEYDVQGLLGVEGALGFALFLGMLSAVGLGSCLGVESGKCELMVGCF